MRGSSKPARARVGAGKAAHTRVAGFTLGMTLAVTLAVTLAAPLRARAAQTDITLDDAVKRALVAQPSMIQAEADRANAKAADRSAWGAYLPTLSTSAGASRSNVSRVDATTGRSVPPEFNYSAGLSANLELFDGFRRYAQKSTAGANLVANEAGVLSQRFQVTLATKQIFYDAAARDELVRVAESQLTRAEQQFKVSVGKLHAGSATRSDSLRSLVEMGNARIALLQANANLASAEANLGRQVGSDDPVSARPDSLIPALPDTSQLRRIALESAPAVKQAEARGRSARAAVWTARAQYWPTVNLTWNDTRQGTGSPFSNFGDYPETSSWRFGLSWTLFNGFAREAEQVRAGRAREVADATELDARRQLSAQLTQQMAALATAYEQISIARSNVDAATEDFRVQNERYRVGAATIVDVTTSQSNLTQAQVNLVQARFNYLIARAQVEALTGREL